MLAFSRIPGNAFSFWIRQKLRWSRGRPELPHESKENLFDYLEDDSERAFAVAREQELRARYGLDDLERASTQAIYRKNLYLVDLLERAVQGLTLPDLGARPLRAVDVGAQDWHYVFGLERWLRAQTGAGTEAGSETHG